MKKNTVIELDITDISNDGNGVGRYDGFAVFVPFSAIGDKLSVKIVKLMKNYAYGRIECVLKSSPDRVADDCAIFRRCGGCCFRHISYESECKIKYNWVKNALKRIGGIDIIPEPIIPSPVISGYRNKAQYPVKIMNSKIKTGFYAKRTHEVISNASCFLEPDFFDNIVGIIREFCTKNNISIYDESSHEGLLRHIYIRYGENSGQVMVCLVINGNTIPGQDELTAMLLKQKNIASIVINVNKEKTNVILGGKYKTVYGESTISENFCGLNVSVSPASFFQVNSKCAEILFNLAKEYASPKPSDLLFDMYCGAGLIGLTMAKDVKKLIGVDIVREAIDDAKYNARLNRIQNADFICADAKQAATGFVSQNLRPDTIILDPPRKGCDVDTLMSVTRMSPGKVVMISCNPATLARDCKMLTEHGFRIERVRPVDMFPRTNHVESVVLLTRKDG